MPVRQRLPEWRRRAVGRNAPRRRRGHCPDAAERRCARSAGYGAFSFESVAERAGVHKTTVYRRWGNKENLILEAMLEQGREHVPIPDTGSLQADLLEFGKAVAANVRAPGVEATARTVASIGDRDSPLAEASRHFWRTRLGLASEIVERAIARGEIPPQDDPELVVEAISAAIYFRLLVRGENLDSKFVESLAELIAAGTKAGS